MKINYVPSTSHWIFPPIVLGVLMILLLIMFIQKIVKCKQDKKCFFDYKNYKFFEKNWDRLKLIGSFILFIFYIKCMNIFGFLLSSIVFIFLFNILFTGVRSGRKSIMNSFIISSSFSIGIWFLFGHVFQITLP